MAIEILPGEAEGVASSNVTSLIRFSDTGCVLPILVNTWGGFVHNVSVTFPKFHLMPQYAGYTQWMVNMSIEGPGNADSVFMAFYFVLGPTVQPYPMLTDNHITDEGDHFKLIQPLALGRPVLILPPGTYYNYVKCTITAVSPSGGVPFTIAESYLYPVKVIVSAVTTPAFFVDYFGSTNGRLSFIYKRGSGIINQSIFVYTNTVLTYEVTGTDLFVPNAIPEPNDNFFRKVSLTYAVPATEPIAGEYSGTINISSGDTTVSVPVTVYVVEDSSFNVTPDDLDFTALTGLDVPGENLFVYTDNSWEITHIPAWLVLSAQSGSGPMVINAGIDYTGLALGDYYAELIVTSGSQQKTVTVHLLYTTFLSSPFVPGKLYFARELEYLVFTSLSPQSKIMLTVDVDVRSLDFLRNQSYTRNYELPMFNGQCRFHLGTVIEQLFDKADSLSDFLNEFDQNHLRAQYRPANVSVYFAEVNQVTGERIQFGEISALKMALGHKPQLTEAMFGIMNVMQQQESRITADSIISCNFSALSPATVFVKKNGVVQDKIVIPAMGVNVFYSYFLFNDNLVPGDSVEIMMKGDFSRTRRFLVFPPGKESTHVFFENENGLLEVFEFTGRRRLLSNYTHKTADRYKDLYVLKEKLISENQQAITINTGYVLPGDHKVIDAIIKSPGVWVSFDSRFGPYFRVDATSTKLTNADTDVAEVSFDVEFNILDNADVTIYLQ